MKAMVKGTHMNRGCKAITSRAFTLIELLLVLVILGVLAGIVVPKFVGRGEQSKKTAAETQIKGIEEGIEQFQLDNDRYPTQEGIRALVDSPAGCPKWHQFYNKMPMDPWGHEYIYRIPGQHNPKGFDVYSMGPDQQDGTADDIGNW